VTRLMDADYRTLLPEYIPFREEVPLSLDPPLVQTCVALRGVRVLVFVPKALTFPGCHK
jgi:hypothetical protein